MGVVDAGPRRALGSGVQVTSGPRFGWRWRSVFVRVVQLGVLLGMVAMRPASGGAVGAWVYLLPLCVVEVALYGIVDGRVVDGGIEYRRWFRWRLVTWDSIERARQNPYTREITLRLANRSLFGRYLFLGRPRPPLSQIWQGDAGAERLRELISG